jgi:uncharacterized integral membrane protein
VKFCYCPECKTLRPRNWYSRGRCETCGGKCTTIKVKRSIFGWLVYFASVIALVFISLYVVHYQMDAQVFDFMNSVPSGAVLILMFGSLLAAFVFQFIELGRTSKEAEGIVRQQGGGLGKEY